MLKVANALAGIRFDHDSGEAALVAALSALEAYPQESLLEDIVVSAGGALSLFRETEGLEWVDIPIKKRDAYFVAWAFAPLLTAASDSGAKSSPTWQKRPPGYEIKTSHAAALSRAVCHQPGPVTDVTTQRRMASCCFRSDSQL